MILRAAHEPAPAGRGFGVLASVALLLLAAPVVAHAQADSVRLAWSAPGDDGNVGTATLYDMRYSTAPITSGNWAAATQVPGMPAPAANGTSQSIVVRGLTNGQVYYFAVRTEDDAGNWSAISNVARWDWVLDTAPPLAPSGIAALIQSPNVRVSWSANSEPDLLGYDVYRAPAPGGPWTRITASRISSTQFVDTSVPPGVTDLYYAATATDNSLNESARSASAHVSFAVVASMEWALQPGYPNPSKAGEPVSIPMMVATSGGAGAVIDIFDAGGRRVRRLELQGLGSGPATVDWNGQNDAGREVAPGVYRAWLIVGDTRKVIRLVRVP
jgi:hypothetical protein